MDGNLGDKGHEIVRYAIRIFANRARFVCADGVEVAQDTNRPLRVSCSDITQNFLDEVFRLAIRVGKADANR